MAKAFKINLITSANYKNWIEINLIYQGFSGMLLMYENVHATHREWSYAWYRGWLINYSN